MSTRSARRVRKGGRLRALAVAPLALALLVVPALPSSSSAATADSSGGVVNNLVAQTGTMFYDPSSHIELFVNFTLATYCDLSAPAEVPVQIHEIDTSNGGVLKSAVHGQNVPIVLFHTSAPVPDLADVNAATCSSGVFIQPAIGTGTGSMTFTLQATPGTSGNSGTWEQSMSGTFVDAATGKTCQVNAYGSGPWSLNPYSFDDVGTINTHGC